MTEIEERISKLGRPSPSDALDHRIEELLLAGEQLHSSYRVRLKLVALLGFIVAVLSAFTIAYRATLSKDVALGTPDSNERLSVNVVVVPEMLELVIREPPTPRLWAADVLTLNE